ncbi:Asp23/Gls24 family envelope stress response protein [Streptomyces sp. 351MFTsu5.1]|uniref:Asp23/Gls24 family envelope stress response protein n=1 Tax=Streptomyces sp. 351MFTsu5.1 TaxID=1172180 RepID=UPI00036F9BF0|nr:Asp23/Gls24 family envelope stress response protein [Streptomyces sp. 351MFTsu5.1]
MTDHTSKLPYGELVPELASAVTEVPGVAFLRPGLADRLRSALPRSVPHVGGTASGTAAGVRLTRPDGEGPWHVEIHVVALRQARTVDVARGVRDAVGDRLGVLAPGEPRPRVTVTVTGLL